MRYATVIAAALLAVTLPVSSYADPADGTYTRAEPWRPTKSPLPSCGPKARKIVDETVASVSDYVLGRDALLVTGDRLPLTTSNGANRLYGITERRTLPDGSAAEVYVGIMVATDGRTVLAAVNSINGKAVCSDGSIARFVRK